MAEDNSSGAIYTRMCGRGEECWEHKGDRIEYGKWDKRGTATNQRNFHSLSLLGKQGVSTLNSEDLIAGSSVKAGNWVGNSSSTLLLTRGKVVEHHPDLHLSQVHRQPEYSNRTYKSRYPDPPIVPIHPAGDPPYHTSHRRAA